MYVRMSDANGVIISHVRDCDLPYQVGSACAEDADWSHRDV